MHPIPLKRTPSSSAQLGPPVNIAFEHDEFCGSPQNPVSNDLSVSQIIESKRRIEGDERGGVDSHSGAPETASSSGLVRAHEEQAVVVDYGDAQAVKPTGAAKEVPVECGVLGKEDDR